MAENKAAKGKRALTKSQVMQELAGETGLTKKQVSHVFEALTGLIKKELKKGVGTFTLPGLAKLRLVRQKARPAGQRPNPFKPGEMMEVKAKPASNKVRIRALKGLNEMVS
jgi:nucleoid DNA-binding protein